MKQLFLFFIYTYLLGTTHAQHYQPVDAKSSVKFIIKNFGMDTEGKFSGIAGSIQFNTADLKKAIFSVSIDASTVSTDIEPRDNNLKEAAYLDVARHPRVSFESRQVTRIGKSENFLLKGVLTIKGTAKEISFPFKVDNVEDGLLFNGEMKLSRADFRIGVGSVVLSDHFIVVLSVFARKMQ